MKDNTYYVIGYTDEEVVTILDAIKNKGEDMVVNLLRRFKIGPSRYYKIVHMMEKGIEIRGKSSHRKTRVFSKVMRKCACCGKEHEPRGTSKFCSNDCSFWGRVIKGKNPEDCWKWAGSTHKGKRATAKTYSLFNYYDDEGKVQHIYAHRYIYRLTTGKDIPKGFHLLHRCNNHTCINPDHMYVGRADKPKKSIDDVLGAIPDELLVVVEEFKDKINVIAKEHGLTQYALLHAWNTIRKRSDLELYACPGHCECFLKSSRKLDIFVLARMQRLLNSGESARSVANTLGVDQSLICRILSGER